MSMLQVRWTLNGSTPTKRKTLAADYNPIVKRMRDFSSDATEVAPSHEAQKANKQTTKSAKQTTKSAVPEMTQQAVSLQSIVAELEVAGLFSQISNAPSSPTGDSFDRKANAKSASARASPFLDGAELSHGAAGLLAAAGLLSDGMPDDVLPAPALDIDAGADASASGAGSSVDGADFMDVGANDEGIDPFSFLQNCCEGASEPRAAPSADDHAALSAPHLDVLRAESVESLASLEVRTANENGPPALEQQASKPGSVQGEGSTSSTSSSPVPSPTPSPLRDAVEDETAPPTKFVEAALPRVRSSEQVFCDLTMELETDQSQSLLSELNGLCDELTDPLPSPHMSLANHAHDGGAAPASSEEEEEQLFLSLQEGLANELLPSHAHDAADDSLNLISKVEAMRDGEPLTFAGFDSLDKTPDKNSRGRGKAKGEKRAAEGDDDDATTMKKAKKTSERKRRNPNVTMEWKSLPDMKAMQVVAPDPNFNHTTPAATPAAKEAAAAPSPECSAGLPAPKFLPGAVEKPQPSMSKAALGGRPAAGVPSLGRTFSWQPIKFPVYK